jgi:hypothetical protein
MGDIHSAILGRTGEFPSGEIVGVRRGSVVSVTFELAIFGEESRAGFGLFVRSGCTLDVGAYATDGYD